MLPSDHSRYKIYITLSRYHHVLVQQPSWASTRQYSLLRAFRDRTMTGKLETKGLWGDANHLPLRMRSGGNTETGVIPEKQPSTNQAG